MMVTQASAKEIDRQYWLSTRTLCFTLISLLLVISGCRQINLPAIDPTGRSIFLPFPNTTQLELPRLRETDGQPGIIPQPAFQTPSTPPPCLDGTCADDGVWNLFDKKHQFVSAVHDHFRSDRPGELGEIQLYPPVVLAPVGGEVVLLAGICGPDGFLVKHEPIEWMLSPGADSVGTFIQVGDDDSGRLADFFRSGKAPIEKLGVDFARGRTSGKADVITRGTPQCSDDIKLREGETWISVSSPTEGVSRITALAPESELWDQRRQNAIIYWVDFDVQFPGAAISPATETIRLTTAVTKADSFVPAAGWKVQYTIVDPNVARFVQNPESNTALVTVDADGNAGIDLKVGPNGRGTTPVQIEVIRPAEDRLPELKLARNSAMVTFSSSGLALRVNGPEQGAPGEQLTYTATIGNPGDLPAQSAKLVFNQPAGARIVAASPEPTVVAGGSGLVWDQGVLDAQRELTVSVVLDYARTGTYEAGFQASSDGRSPIQQSVRTQIVQPSVEVRFEPINGQAQAEVGSTIQYNIDVTNTGRQTITDLELLIESDEGLPEAMRQLNSVKQSIAYLQPGETRPIAIGFKVQQQRQLGARLTVSSGGAVLAERQVSILGVAPTPKQPAVGVELNFPRQLQVGEQQIATITVKNPGEVTLTGLRVVINHPGLEATQTDDANRLQAGQGQSVWTPRDLLPGNGTDVIAPIRIQFAARESNPAATISVAVSCNEGVQASDSVDFRIVEAARAPAPPSSVLPEVTPGDGNPFPPGNVLPGNNPPPAATPGNVLPEQPEQRTGKLSISIDDLRDPTAVGAKLRYAVRVANRSNQAYRGVNIEVWLPQGVDMIRQDAVGLGGKQVDIEILENNQFALPTQQFLRPGDVVDFIIVVIPRIPQTISLRARAYSGEEQVVDTATTTVTPLAGQ